MRHIIRHEFMDVTTLSELRQAVQAVEFWPSDADVEINEYGTQVVISHEEYA